MKKILCLCIGVILVAGCSSTKKTLYVKDTDPAILKLVEVADSIAAYDRKLSAVEAAKYYKATGKTIGNHDISMIPGLNQVESLGATWNGPLDKLLIELSVLANLNAPRFINRKPPGGIMVSLKTDYRRIIDMILDAESQTAQANISLKMRERLLEIEYIYHR